MGGFLLLCLGAYAQGVADDSARLDWFELTPTERFSPFTPYAGRVDFPSLAITGTPDPEPRAVLPKPRKPRTKAKVQPSQPSQKKAPMKVIVAPEPVAPESGVKKRRGDCGDDLEVFAAAGKLTPEQSSCLVDARSRGKQVKRSKASRILLLQAAADRDDTALSELLAYHLDKLDQSDPSLCLTYAQLLERQGKSLSSVRWADTALENRHQWTGPGFVENVSASHELRARGAYAHWQHLESTRSLQNDVSVEVEKSRNRAKTYAREWVEYQRSAGLGAAEADGVCVSAAGSADYCR